MSLSKSELYNALKEAGASFEKPYANYTLVELRALADQLSGPTSPVTPTEDGFYSVPMANESSETYGGMQAYQPNAGETPIRTDAQGRIWFREEVRKPDTPRPRARRKITYIDPGVQQQTFRGSDRFVETIEVAGTAARSAEVKITMPSYQVGVYADPRMPFKYHVYNGNKGFDLFDVQSFYGGADLVPASIKRVYVGNDLCYDIRTTIRAVQDEYRQTVLKG